MTIGQQRFIFSPALVTALGVALWLLVFPIRGLALLWKGRRLMTSVTVAAILLSYVPLWLSRPDRADLVSGTRMIVAFMGVTLLGVS